MIKYETLDVQLDLTGVEPAHYGTALETVDYVCTALVAKALSSRAPFEIGDDRWTIAVHEGVLWLELVSGDVRKFLRKHSPGS